MEKRTGRLRWTGGGKGIEAVDSQNFYRLLIFNRSAGFIISPDEPSATHELFLQVCREGTQQLLLRQQYDWRIPSRNPDTVARWIAESIISTIRFSAIPRMTGEGARDWSGKIRFASSEEIEQYWGYLIHNSFESLLEAALQENMIPRYLFEMDREFYFQSYPS